MTGPWTYDGQPPNVANQATLVAGSSFCISDPGGDIAPDRPQGLFVRDVRILSTWQLLVDGVQCEPLVQIDALPFRSTYLSRRPALEPPADPGLLVERVRAVSRGMRETVRLHNSGPRARCVTVEMRLDADLADVFEVKESRQRERALHLVEHEGDTLRFGDSTHGAVVSAPGAQILTEARRGRSVSGSSAPARLRWNVELQPHSVWEVDLSAGEVLHGVVRLPAEIDDSVRQLRTWTRAAPGLHTASEDLRVVLERAVSDLGALRMSDERHPGEHPVAAGAPWFMALFGRDSLLTSYMALPVDPRLASDTLRVLARYQGTRVDLRTEEQPGRILHETRLGEDADLALGGGRIYYGSVDATPLFVLLLGELRRWGLGDEALSDLLPAADRGLTWCREFGDRDGDGLIEYQRLSESGLRNQGWKDSGDSISFANGEMAEPPIALAEVQGYWYAALQGRAAIASSMGEDPTPWLRQAQELQDRFDEAFWVPERGWYAMALDGAKRPVDALASNIGHCLWTGIVPAARAEAVAEQLLSPEMFSGWGLRTLSSAMACFDPMSYHNGAVWPHDTAIAAAGLMRYGFVTEAQTLSLALLDAATALGGRLPELFCGFDRSAFAVPIGYPASCSPQAWSSASPLLLLRSLLRFEPDAPGRRLQLGPALPTGWAPLSLSQIPAAGTRLALRVDADGSYVTDGLPAGYRMVDASTAAKAGA